MPRSAQLSFRPATPNDAAVLAALHTEVAEHLTKLMRAGPGSGATMTKGVLIAMRTSHVYRRNLGTELVGTFRLATKKPWAIDTSYFSAGRKPLYLLAMAVDPARQRQGIGGRCLQETVLRLAKPEI